LTTDAAEPGWGAELRIGGRQLLTYGFFLIEDSPLTSNQRETSAVLRALKYFRPELAAARVSAITVRSDNAPTVCNLQRQGAGLALLQLTRAIFRILQGMDIRLHVAHIPGRENEMVDSLSRMEVTGDYALKQEVFNRTLLMLQVLPTVDLFAHRFNNKLSRFVAMNGLLAVGAVATDAFAFSWRGELPYAFPPVQLVGQVLQRIQQEDMLAVLVVPKWPSQPWWGLFRDMAIRTCELGSMDEVLTPGLAMTGSHVTLKLPRGIFLMAVVRAVPTTVSTAATFTRL
jgi:hypothetical protein